MAPRHTPPNKPRMVLACGGICHSRRADRAPSPHRVLRSGGRWRIVDGLNVLHQLWRRSPQ
eukprot:11224716-Lingulodinium_polyedra.AAC.1